MRGVGARPGGSYSALHLPGLPPLRRVSSDCLTRITGNDTTVLSEEEEEFVRLPSAGTYQLSP